MCEWMPSSCSSGRASTASSPCIAGLSPSGDAIERPNFWSSWAVEMYSWPPACTPVVTRTITGARRSAARGDRVGHPVDLDERVDDDPADAGVERPRDLRVRLVVAVQADVGAGDPGAQRDGELAARGGVDAQALLVHPARDRDGQERLARVVHVDAGADLRERRLERAAVAAGAGAEVGLVEHVRRACRARRRARARRRRRRVTAPSAARATPVDQGSPGIVVLTCAPARSRPAARDRWRAPGGWRRSATGACGARR